MLRRLGTVEVRQISAAVPDCPGNAILQNGILAVASGNIILSNGVFALSNGEIDVHEIVLRVGHLMAGATVTLYTLNPSNARAR
jgi:hypothetical protein